MNASVDLIMIGGALCVFSFGIKKDRARQGLIHVAHYQRHLLLTQSQSGLSKERELKTAKSVQEALETYYYSHWLRILVYPCPAYFYALTKAQ